MSRFADLLWEALARIAVAFGIAGMLLMISFVVLTFAWLIEGWWGVVNPWPEDQPPPPQFP